MPEATPELQRWLMVLAAAVTGIAVGALAYHWKRRNAVLWMLYGAVTFGAAAVILAGLPRLERRLSPERENSANWHA